MFFVKSKEVTAKESIPQGVDVIASTPAELAAFVKQDFVRYEKLIRAAGIRIE